MNLRKKKILAAKTLGVGKNRILFIHDALNEIKEAITKQDIKSLHSEGAIHIRPIHGRKKVKQRKRKVGWGKTKMNVKHRKRDYITLTRKLRAVVSFAKNSGTISKETYYDIRKKIKNRYFKSGGHLKEYIENFVKPAENSLRRTQRTSSLIHSKSNILKSSKINDFRGPQKSDSRFLKSLKTGNDSKFSIKNLEVPASGKTTSAKPKKKTTRSKK